MTTTPAESDPLFQLLTEALRAGPGSAQWGEAVAKLRDGGVEGADEYRLIIRARENLEKGRDFRMVTAGPGFTRKVLDALEREGSRRTAIPTATIVAILSSAVILGVIITVIVIMSRGGVEPDPSQAAIERLQSQNFSLIVASADFKGALPEGWRAIGALPLTTADGLRAGAAPKDAGAFVGGGVVCTDPIDAGQAFAVETDIQLPSSASEAAVQIFVTDAADFTQQRATAERELAVILRDGRATVDAEGRTQGEALVVKTREVKVNIRIEADVTIVEVGGRRLYAGEHGLTRVKARFAGVRFIRPAGDASESPIVGTIYIAQSASSGAAGPK